MTCTTTILTNDQGNAQGQDRQPHPPIVDDLYASCMQAGCESEPLDTSPASVREAAKRYVASGLSVIPIADDGSKMPFWEVLPRLWDEQGKRYRPSWKPYQVFRPTEDEIESWSQDGKCFGLAVVTGLVSGKEKGCGLEVIDFDTVALFQPWAGQVESALPGLLRRLVQVQSPRPGRHVYYRCSEIGGSQKLAAEMVERDDGTGRLEKVTRIETKGEGGYCLVPPSPRWCHPSLKCYRLVEGSPDLTAVPLISPAERSVLLNAARSFNQCTTPALSCAPKSAARPAIRPCESGREGRPGDVFNQEADWEEILVPHGWVRAGSSGNTTHWRRPGKDCGTSATTGHCQSSEDGIDLFHVFSSNAEPFEEGRSYSKFITYALLEHQGDLSAAARELRTRGFGGSGEASKVESYCK
jgi:hypothetical protein